MTHALTKASRQIDLCQLPMSVATLVPTQWTCKLNVHGGVDGHACRNVGCLLTQHGLPLTWIIHILLLQRIQPSKTRATLRS